MNNFLWNSETLPLPNLDFAKVEEWLKNVATSHGRFVGDINYTFCNDEEILKTNREFLNHDYYTDIITFDRSTRSMIKGDIVISLDTVESNARGLGQDFDKELLRVVVHGVLHLCGIDDKGPGQRIIMEEAENRALSMYEEMQ